MHKDKFEIAFCYDFDGTLSPGNMQEYSFIPKLKLQSDEFWMESNKLAKDADADTILTYMHLMCKRARNLGIQIHKSDFSKFGKSVEFFNGILADKNNKIGWFERINKYAASLGANARHYIISSGIKEMIEGTAIAKELTKIYASSFMYDAKGSAMWPAQAVNYTTKMQFLFRINKGKLGIHESINDYMPESERPVPFRRIIYFGDGTTDIPAMKLVKTQGGYSIAVHDANKENAKTAKELLSFNRVDFVSEANYAENSELDLQVKRVIAKICAEKHVEDQK